MAKGDQSIPVPEMGGGKANDVLRSVRREMKAIRRDLEKQARDGKEFDKQQVKRLQELSQLEKRADRVKGKYERARAEATKAEVVARQIERNTSAALRAQQQAQRAGRDALVRDSQATRAARLIGSAGAIRNLARGQLGASDIAYFAASPDFFENASKIAGRLGFAKQAAALSKVAQGIGIAAPYVYMAVQAVSTSIGEKAGRDALRGEISHQVATGQISATEARAYQRQMDAVWDRSGTLGSTTATAQRMAQAVRSVGMRQFSQDEATSLFLDNSELVLRAQQQAMKRIQSEESRQGRSLTDAEQQRESRAAFVELLATMSPDEALRVAEAVAEATKRQESNEYHRQLERMRPTAVYERHERDAMARIEWQRRRDRVPMLLTD